MKDSEKINKAKRIALSLVSRLMWEATNKRSGQVLIPEIYRIFTKSNLKKNHSNAAFDAACAVDPNFEVGHVPLYSETDGQIIYTMYTSVGVYRVKIYSLQTDTKTDGYKCEPLSVEYKTEGGEWKTVMKDTDFAYWACGNYGIKTN